MRYAEWPVTHSQEWPEAGTYGRSTEGVAPATAKRMRRRGRREGQGPIRAMRPARPGQGAVPQLTVPPTYTPTFDASAYAVFVERL